jgi:hypothetical protein
VTSVAGLAFVLGFGLPWLLESMTPWLDAPSRAMTERNAMLRGLLLVPLALTALYLSSLASSGLRAVIASMAVMAASVPIGRLAIELVGEWSQLLVRSLSGYAWYRHLDRDWFGQPVYVFVPGAGRLMAHGWLLTGAFLAALAVIGAMLLRFGLINHASAERATTRAWRQAGWIGVAILACILSVGVIAAAVQPNAPYDGAGGVAVRGRVVFKGKTPAPAPDELRWFVFSVDPVAASVFGSRSSSVNPTGRF